MQEYTVRNEQGETVDTTTDKPHAKLAAINLREMTGEAFEVYDPNGEFVSRHDVESAAKAARIEKSSRGVETRMHGRVSR